ncbi:serine/threonine protein kinase [Gloeobacter kilaueensis JS1]|uniref:Serine/threonine protein kinase n=2 Tax=Gloeobacter TaxID=33071 RepID=U5QKN9_GLOK1|nr:serine/threonine protein kinase [Gloeobacter kilaueensis JS1]
MRIMELAIAADGGNFPLNESLDSPIGRLFGERYRISRFVAGGGMGRVFQAIDTRLAGKIVAIKLLSLQLLSNPQLATRLRQWFEQEAQLSAILGKHSRIIQVTDYGVDAGQPYLVMEYLEGRSLKQLIESEGVLALERVLNLAVQMCEGLQFAHSLQTRVGGRQLSGVIHRDIKPSNIFVIDEGRLGETVKILDFGVAKVVGDVQETLHTQSGFVGTPQYASPELLRGEALDCRSDIYSLGVILYQMLTARLPFSPQTNSFGGWYHAHNHLPPIDLGAFSPEVPEAFARTVMACLAKERDERPATMAEVSDRLQAAMTTPTLFAPTSPAEDWRQVILSEQPIALPATVPSEPDTPKKPTAGRRHLAWRMILLAALAALVVLLLQAALSHRPIGLFQSVHHQGDACWARAIVSSIPRALLRVSSYSTSGTESATSPAPA